MDKLKIGIIGVGGIAQGRHIPAFTEMSDRVELVAVHDVNQVLAESIAEQHHIPHVCTDYNDVFPYVDAVTICTPNKFHAEISIAALQAGVHVLCEKPMAMTPTECEDMVTAARKHNKLLSIAYHYRYTEAAIRSKLAVEAGAVGKPLVIRVQALRRRKVPGWGVFTNKELQGGGSLIDYGCHFLDLSLWLLGEIKPVEVLSKTYNNLSTMPNQLNEWGAINHETFDVDDHVTSFITFDNGATMHFECSWSANVKADQMHISISGEQGGLNVYPFETYTPKYGTFVTESADAPHDEHKAAQQQARNFVDSCLGLDTLVVQPEQAQTVNQLIDAIYRSSETGHSIVME